MKAKFGLMKRILYLEDCFDDDELDKLVKEFNQKIPDSLDDDWMVMDSDEAPYCYYAKAFIDGYREAKRGNKK